MLCPMQLLEEGFNSNCACDSLDAFEYMCVSCRLTMTLRFRPVFRAKIVDLTAKYPNFCSWPPDIHSLGNARLLWIG